MRYSKFQTESGIQFYYDNVENKLHESDGSLIDFGRGSDWSSYYEFAKETYS